MNPEQLCGKKVTIVMTIDDETEELVIKATFEPPLRKSMMTSGVTVIASEAIRYAELFAGGEIAEVDNLPRTDGGKEAA